jgi:hypothetical protein
LTTIHIEEIIMTKRLFAVLAGLLGATPAHALPIISLHGGGAWHVQFSSMNVDPVWLAGSLAALGALVIFRALRRARRP